MTINLYRNNHLEVMTPICSPHVTLIPDRHPQENRAVGSTDMNQESSRSHAILTVIIERQQKDNHIVVGKLNLVDLAGSERQSKTNAEGKQLTEAKHINQVWNTTCCPPL